MKIQSLIEDLKEREKVNNQFLHLTINENQLSKSANFFLNTKLSERYYFGGGVDGVVDFVNFTFVGMPEVENLVNAATEALKRMSGGAVVNINCLSGIHAMMSAILSVTEPGDVVMTLNQEDGGHFATQGIIKRIGRKHIYAEYDLKTLQFDVKKTAKKFKKAGAKALYLDVSNHINPHNLAELRKELGNEVIIIYDASHTIGLILGRQFQSPFKEGADVICANTHKTLAGPQKGIVIFKDEVLGNKANQIISGYLYSSVHVNHLIALAITILEWEQYGEQYAKQVIANARALGQAFTDLGYEVRISNRGTFTENEQLHVFVDKLGDRIELYKRLVDNNISTNFQNVMGGRNFVRIGSQEVTRRGMKEKDMKVVAGLVHGALAGKNVKPEVIAFNDRFKEIEYSFDRLLSK